MAGIAGRALEFQLNGGAWTPADALTDATGKAQLLVNAPALPGNYIVNARFAGDGANAASAGTAKLVVASKRRVCVLTTNRAATVGSPVKLYAYLYRYLPTGDLLPLAGKSLRFRSAGTGLDATVLTDATGKATVTTVAGAPGNYAFTVDFAGDADYYAGSGAGTLTAVP